MTADIAAMVDRARNAVGAIAADLAPIGGLLRCGSCGAEQPLGDVGHHVGHGWPSCCGQTMTWVTPRLLAWERRQPSPDGYHLEAVPAGSLSGTWEIDRTRTCRRITAGHEVCRRPSAAVLWRHYGTGEPRRWPYCANHMYGNWVQDGTVMCWVLRPDE